MIVRNGFNTELFSQLGEWFSVQGDEVRYVEFKVDRTDDYFQLPNKVMRYGPHVVQGSVSWFPLLICQIVCGIPTVVQAQDNLEQQYLDLRDQDPRTAITMRMLQSFTTTGASAVVTSHKEIARGMRVQNPLAEYIPRPREVRFLDCGHRDGVVGLLGNFKEDLLGVSRPDAMKLTQLEKTELSRGRDGSKFILQWPLGMSLTGRRVRSCVCGEYLLRGHLGVKVISMMECLFMSIRSRTILGH